jgi:DNA-binding CsgD family transcriptional regulator
MNEATSAALVEMIDHVYAATINPERWSEFLKVVSGHFRDASTILWHTDHNDDHCNIFSSYRYEQSALQAMRDHYYWINPWVPKKMAMPGGALHRTEALYPEAKLIKTEFYNDWLVPNDLFKGFGISLFNDRRFGFLSIIRSQRAGPPSSEELRLLGLLTPHLQRAVQLHERLRFSPQYAAPALAALDSLSRGVMFIGRDKRTRYMNRAASRILASADGLFLDRTGSVKTSLASHQAALDQMVDGAIAGRPRVESEHSLAASGGAILLRRPSGARSYCVVVAPTPPPPFGLTSSHAAAIVLISDPDADASARHDLLRQLYQLSEKEAQLAGKISDGERLESAAQDMGISYQTARSYLKGVFAKLGVSRQAELASLVQKLSVVS